MTTSMCVVLFVILVLSFLGSELKGQDDRDSKDKINCKINPPDSK